MKKIDLLLYSPFVFCEIGIAHISLPAGKK
jgi:hypothetical protein